MRTTKLLSLLALVVFLACNVRAFAAAPDRKTTADGVQTLYIYGVSQNLNDTIAYVSDITVITGSHLLEKGYFLQRDQYADQFKDYVQQRFASPHQTTAVFFDTRIEAARSVVRNYVNNWPVAKLYWAPSRSKTCIKTNLCSNPSVNNPHIRPHSISSYTL